MRLLDLISQGRSTPIHLDNGFSLPTAGQFVRDVQDCPLRYVLSDDLVRCATQLAYAEGDRLSGCLDLIRVPAHSLWVEWAEEPRTQALKAIPSLAFQCRARSQRGGALITASSDCRSGYLRTFWSTDEDLAYLSPVVTDFDLDRSPAGPSRPRVALWRGDAILRLEQEPAIDELLEHLRFHFDDEWAAYYNARCHTPHIKTQVLHANMGGVAYDALMLIALFLLLGAHDVLQRQPVRHERINRERQRAGKALLLEHVEVSAPLYNPRTSGSIPDGEASRLSPRLHHVRGHIVRRGTTVFWRSPHLRGNARLGRVRSRTVALSFARAASEVTSQLL
jgi:hypothetical protein